MVTKRIAPTDQPMREIRPMLQRYYDLFRPCETEGCYEIVDSPHGSFCDRCASNREFEARLAARRQARGR